MTALTELLAKVEADEWPSNLGLETMMGYRNDILCERAFHGSLDAAHELHEDVLPEASSAIRIWAGSPMTRVDIDGGGFGYNAIPSRAWLIAILRAMIEKEKP